MIPQSFWEAIAGTISIFTIFGALWLAGKVAYNFRLATTRPVTTINETHNHYRLNNCTLVEPEDLR